MEEKYVICFYNEENQAIHESRPLSNYPTKLNTMLKHFEPKEKPYSYVKIDQRFYLKTE
jgi:hypothetical protein